MSKILCALLFIPVLVQAQQPVKPVLSADYISLINNDSLTPGKVPAAGNINNSWHIRLPLSAGIQIKAIKTHQDVLSIVPVTGSFLSIGGSYSIGAALKSANAGPSLQNDFVQGESSNGTLAWQGPETNEPFSYGPSIHNLEYDGSSYPYDINGRLVKSGAGNGQKALPYDNSILRTGYMTSQSFSFHGSIANKYSWPPRWIFSLTAGRNDEHTIISDNKNSTHKFSASIERNIHKIKIGAGYNRFSSWFSNDNSNGFLNRVYQNALLTPVSFSNRQGTLLDPTHQRSYSSIADNPVFLLKDNGHSADLVQQTGNFSLSKKQGKLTFVILSSLDAVDAGSNQSLKPGTASFPPGLLYNRLQNDRNFSTNAYGAWNISYTDYHYSSTAKLTYIYNDEDSKIALANTRYHYQRSANDASFTFNTVYNNNDINIGINAGNKFYTSNTSRKTRLLLPDLSSFIRFMNIMDYRLNAKLVVTYNSFYSEAPINRTLSAFLLTQLTPQQASSFLPVTEIQGFNGLSPMQHREYSSKFQLDYQGRVSVSADLNLRDTRNNLFPVYENNQLVLKNLADTRYKGLEIQLDFNTIPVYGTNFSISNSLSFYKFSNTVTNVREGYDSLPIAGFSTVHKTLIKGQPLGVITGSSYLRDAGNNILIGNDGFPLVDARQKIIGNPNPEFTLKFSHILSWEKFTLNIDWEYRKGGDVWNGSQAVLDYYGRSAASASERNIKDYVFPGLLQNGSHNNIPVSFYDASLPVGQNRWVRYGYTGVAASYIQKGDNIRIHNLGLAYNIRPRKYLQNIRFMVYAENLLVWSAYKGADPNQLLYDQPGSMGLDFFNLPSTRSIGANISIQF